MEFVEFIENPTKTRQSGLSAKPRSFLPKMFASGDDKCPVAIFKEFLWRRPPELRTTGPLYLSCVKDPSSQVWYKRQPMGVNKINEMMRSIIAGTSLHDSSKAFSNHSARKTVVKKLKTAGLERSSIAKVTGHRNLQSLDDYDEADENEQRQLSHTISSASNSTDQLACGNHPSTNTANRSSSSSFNPFASGAQGYNAGLAFPSTFPTCISGQNDQSQRFMNVNLFYNCQVTFNMGSGNPAPEIQPAKSTTNAEDGD